MGKMSLENIHRGRMVKPDRSLVYGTEGVGKSTFAASAPGVIFLAKEDGIKHLDVQSFPQPETFDDLIDAVRVLREDKHDRLSLAIDTVDWIEPLIFNEVIKTNRDWKTIEDPGYGKGYNLALDYWRMLLADLDRLRAERGMEIILLGHAQASNFNNPAGPDYTRYELAMNKRGAALLKQWADSVLFACYEETVAKDKGELRAKGRSTGARVMHTEHRAAFDAKNRYCLPEVLPLSYEDYMSHRDGGQDTASLAAQLDAALDKLAPEKSLRKKILDYSRKSEDNLAPALNRVRALIQEKQNA